MEYAASKDFHFAPPDVPLQQLAQETPIGGGGNGGPSPGGGGIEDLLSPAFVDTVTLTVHALCRIVSDKNPLLSIGALYRCLVSQALPAQACTRG